VRSSRGQAAPEYAAALLVVAIVLAAAATLTPLPALGASVVAQLRHGICLVSNAICTGDEARHAGLAACPVRLRSNTEDASVTIAVVKIGRSDALAIERRSDGTASVSFVDGGEVGAELGLGVRFAPLGLKGTATAGGGVQFAGGRAWDFPTWAAADAFVGRYARRETLTGEVKDRLCLWCGEDDPPPADETFTEGGAYVEAALDAGVTIRGHGAELTGEVAAATILGLRRAGRRRTAYVRIRGESVGRLGAVIGTLGTEGAAEAVLEYTTEDERPLELRIRAGGEYGASVAVAGPDLGGLAEQLRAAAARGGGLAGEASVALDLRDPANLEAAHGVLAALRSPTALPDRLAGLGHRLDADGTLDVRVFRTGVQRDETGADVALGARLGVHYERVERGRELLRAWTSVAGGPLREREDCVATA
jgi:hypothetical protein